MNQLPPSAQDIRSLRNRLYLTRSQFAELVGCSRSSIVNWELGRSSPREDYAQTIAEILQFQTDRQVTSAYITICLTHEETCRK